MLKSNIKNSKRNHGQVLQALSIMIRIGWLSIFTIIIFDGGLYAEDVAPFDPIEISGLLPRALTGEMQQSEEDLPMGIVRKAPRYSSHEIPPSTIKVALTGYANCGDWIDAGYPVSQVIEIDFADYVKDVLPNEWYSSWYDDGYDSLAAGAIAVKTFAWHKVNTGWRSYLPGSPDVVDNTCDQRYIQGSHDWRTDNAVNETWNHIMRREEEIFEIHYQAHQYQCDDAGWPDCMGQWESYYMAMDDGKNWEEILSNFYEPLTINMLDCGPSLCGNVGGCRLQNGIYVLACDAYLDAGNALYASPDAMIELDDYSLTIKGNCILGP